MDHPNNSKIQNRTLSSGNKDMKETITVRKNIHERGLVRWSCIVYLISVIVLVFMANQSWFPILIVCMIPLVWMLVLLIHFETWKITFSKSYICKSSFFSKQKHSYISIRYAQTGWSYTERKYIMIVFDDGKKITFRMNDENAKKAIIKILRYCSIRNTRDTRNEHRGRYLVLTKKN